MGNIYHEWNGTVLTITSDSGTSSSDLKGSQGEMGIRGPQGAKGEVGQVDPSLLDDYATQEYVRVKVAEAQLPESEVDLSDFYTKTEADAIVENNVKERKQETANALKGEKSGELVAITDTSPVEQDVEVKLSSKNLIPYPYATEETRRGITFTPNTDGTVTVNGQNDGTGTARLTFTHTNWDLPLGDYTIHDGHDVCNASVQILKADGSYKYVTNNPFTLNEGDKITGMWVQVLAADSDVVFDNVVVKPQLERGTTATAYTPYIGNFEDVTVSAMGKNLYAGITSASNNSGFTLDDVKPTASDLQSLITEDGGITLEGTVGTVQMSIKLNLPTLPAGTYVYSTTLANTQPHIFITHNGVQSYYSNGKPFTIYEGDTIDYLQIRANVGTTLSGVCYIQIEQGSTATDYEPYIEPVTYTANAEGTVEGVKSINPNMTLTTDTTGVLLDVEYNRDINKAFAELQQAIISLGGNV